MTADIELAATGTVPVVVRRAAGADVVRLQAEGERLRRAAHPGVVQVVSSSGDADAWELATAHGGRPLPVAAPLAPETLAGVVAAVASTLADLHALGIVHGRLRPDHILLGPLGRPVLCGFGPGPLDDDVAAPSPADDVAALGSILADLLGDDADVEPMPDRRWQRRRGWAGWVRRSLLTLADQACADPPSRRPSARRFAAAISETVPGAAIAADGSAHDDRDDRAGVPADPIEALRADVEQRDRRDTHLRGRRLVARAGAAATVVGIGLAALGTVGIAGRPTTDADRMPSTTTLPPTTGPPAAPVETTSQPSSPPCAVRTDAAVGDTCAEQISVAGTVVTVGERRFEVGRPGDHVVVGDWDCDGALSAALLRPATGDVFIFPSWAEDGELTVRPVVSVPGAARLVTEEAGGCHALRARLRSGEIVAITELGG